MKIAFYCQHILGIGHFQRSLLLCRALLARGHRLTLILGGPEIEVTDSRIEVLQLPGLRMDAEFGGLLPCDEGAGLADIKEQRQKMLYQFFQEEEPDIFITELYPMGRKAFRFELDPVLQGIDQGSLAPCFCCSSVRDILVEKSSGREKFEERAVKTLNRYFDGLLIHADANIISLDETFARTAEVVIPKYYTGFIAPEMAARGGGVAQKEDDLPLVIASIGGGSVGGELLEAVASASQEGTFRLKIFCGRYSSAELKLRLEQYRSPLIEIVTFSHDFQREMEAADLSISMAGYNTCMNILRAGTPALLYPFQQNREQGLRVKKLGIYREIQILSEADLPATRLRERIEEMLGYEKFMSKVELDGAMNSALQVEAWFEKFTAEDHNA
ncbi:glycosyltransferase family protein [Desulfotalea psychrophila]|uniref:Glycosyl transferase family 28 C-terminal domain-containing protein n=1 Tax=Desulfotalea psychrophila (strain LSv54 / DSM 12343) TaxID=177439 RepID=Q6AME5_DESPS|nr:glycosyltransferase [Desulfotalea psychrophila]CAG36480.1 hypothetical protein DP1751 [Desulfotalea psychrophila LSv54]